jgi:hypothetical protein
MQCFDWKQKEGQQNADHVAKEARGPDSIF